MYVFNRGLRLAHVIFYQQSSSFFFKHQPTDNHKLFQLILPLLAISFPQWGLPFGDMVGPTLWPQTGPWGEVQNHWLAGRVDADCSKLTVSALLMLSRDAGVQLPHLASPSGLSQPPQAPVSLPASFLFDLCLKHKSGHVLHFSS